MQIYLFWGEDDFSLTQAVDTLRQKVIDPNWASFNYDKILPDQGDAVISALNQAMTPPFGAGSRFVWLADTPITQQCSQELFAELERTLPVIPSTTVLLLTTRNKPDSRLKSTKFLLKSAEVREFSPIPPWKTEELAKRVRQVAEGRGVKLTPAAIALLAECVGNDTRQLNSELDKLELYAGNSNQPLGDEAIAALVRSNTQNSLQLAAAIRQGNTAQALQLVAELIGHNEPALKIVATLTTQFRIWLWVKLGTQAGEPDEKIAQAAEISNPKRIYFFRQEVKSLTVEKLQQTLPLLLELESSLKRGAQEVSTLQTKVIELCTLFY
ncbi:MULTISPECIES: DNA polymerase III subunit delta [Kamptonema]|uniref:DNA polymerase III subunit delta n=1 Tax=Kamptonema TaxID=1501433 RepID=UPI0001DAC6A2|nr:MULTISPECIES: DNA polymerase III subunit delta [Kamptonema]CBN55483.1 DNA polymerase III subunit delta [Kamptonema sp. PCC 6506]